MSNKRDVASNGGKRVMRSEIPAWHDVYEFQWPAASPDSLSIFLA